MSTQSSYRSQTPASASTVTKGDSNELLIDDVAQIDGLSIRTSGKMDMTSSRSRVVVVGGGFGGLQAVKALARADVDVTLIDRNNYHLFQPLSFQVATGSLSPGEIAVPLRQIFRREPRVRVVMGEVTGFDLKRREVLIGSAVGGISTQRVSYDALLVAGGSATATSGASNGDRSRLRSNHWTVRCGSGDGSCRRSRRPRSSKIRSCRQSG